VGGSLSLGTWVRVGSSLDNDGTRWYCQTARVRLTRRKGVREEPALIKPLNCCTGSNLVDLGWGAARTHRRVSVGNSWAGNGGRSGGCGEGLRRTRSDAAGAESGTSFVDRSAVNVGTTPRRSPSVLRPAGVGDRRVAGRRGGVGRSPRSTPSAGKLRTWGRRAADSRSKGLVMPGDRR
jgi:hypothetical protein